MNIYRYSKKKQELLTEIEQLQAQLAETEEILRAIRCGEVDAFFVPDETGGSVLTLEGTESAYRVLVEAMSEGATILMDNGMLLYCNSSLAAMLKVPLESVMGASLDHYLPPAYQDTFKKLLEQAQIRTCAGEVTFICADEASLPVWLSLSPMRIHGQPGICLIATDLTERKQMEEELRNFSLEDDLTKLYNRRGFFTMAQQHMKIACRQEEQLFLIFIDLDDLKLINDNLGHLEGDHALTDTTDILKNTFRESDIIARLGGDEFAVLALAPLEINSETFSKRLQSQLDAHNALGHRPYHLAMSVGIVRYDPKAPMPIADLLAHADAAMYEQKRAKHENAITSARMPRKSDDSENSKPLTPIFSRIL